MINNLFLNNALLIEPAFVYNKTKESASTYTHYTYCSIITRYRKKKTTIIVFKSSHWKNRSDLFTWPVLIFIAPPKNIKLSSIIFNLRAGSLIEIKLLKENLNYISAPKKQMYWDIEVLFDRHVLIWLSKICSMWCIGIHKSFSSSIEFLIDIFQSFRM